MFTFNVGNVNNDEVKTGTVIKTSGYYIGNIINGIYRPKTELAGDKIVLETEIDGGAKNYIELQLSTKAGEQTKASKRLLPDLFALMGCKDGEQITPVEKNMGERVELVFPFMVNRRIAMRVQYTEYYSQKKNAIASNLRLVGLYDPKTSKSVYETLNNLEALEYKIIILDDKVDPSLVKPTTFPTTTVPPAFLSNTNGSPIAPPPVTPMTMPQFAVPTGVPQPQATQPQTVYSQPQAPVQQPVFTQPTQAQNPVWHTHDDAARLDALFGKA